MKDYKKFFVYIVIWGKTLNFQDTKKPIQKILI